MRLEIWKKSWLIYRSKIISVYCRIATIDVINSKIYMEVYFDSDWIYCKKLKKDVYIYNRTRYFVIPIDREYYTNEKFKKDLLYNSLNLVGDIEQSMICKYSGYSKALDLESEYEHRLREIAEDFLDDNKVSNSEIREAYIEKFISNANIPNYSLDFVKEMEYTVIPYEYLMMCAFFDDKVKYEDYSERCNKVRKSTGIKLWLAIRKLDSEEFVVEMEKLLEGI